MICILGLTILASATAVQSSSREIPEELLAAARRSEALFRTGRVEWTQETRGEKRRYTSVYGGGDVLLIDDGINADVTQVTTPAPKWTFLRKFTLLRNTEDEQWSYFEHSPIAQVREPDCSDFVYTPDVLAVGFVLNANGWLTRDAKSPTSALRKSVEGASHFEVARAKDGVRVLAYWSTGRSVEWTLDPKRDYLINGVHVLNPTADGGLSAEDFSFSYEQTDGRWFPTTIEFSKNGELREKLEVQYAEFDRPYHPNRLVPGEVLNMPAGVNIYRLGQDDARFAMGVFDGIAGIIPMSEYGEAIASGRLRLDEFRALLALPEEVRMGCYPRGSMIDDAAVAFKVSRRPGLWEEYTRAFIRRHQLDKRQQVRAWELLSECQRKAHAHLSRYERDINETQKSILALRAGKDPECAEKLTKAEDKLNNLYEPVDRIFSRKLQPGLIDLLTAAQKDRFEKERNSSGPTARP